MAQSPYLDQNAPEILALERQKKLADLLQARALEQPQGQMVSGRYVAPSIIQQLAPLANAYMGRKAGEDVESRQAKLANLIRGQNVAETKDIFSTMMGQPEVVREGSTLGDEEGNVLPFNKAAVAPDKMGALMKALNAQSSGGQALAPQLMSSLFKEDTPLVVPRGGTVVNRKGDVIARGTPEEEKFPVSYQEYLLAKKEGYTGSYQQYQNEDANRKQLKINIGDPTGMVGGGVNNNGVPVGKFDKTGRYISPKGEVFPATAVTAARTEHDAATDLAFKLDQLSKKDIKNAYGSLTDYTTSRVGRMVGPDETINAQTKINNLQIGALLDNLSRLKGASSDKEMAQMIKDFPGYEASPKIMENWVERASTATNRFLKRSENRFGFDTEYATENRFGAKEEPKTTDEKFTIRRKQQ
jgi:hypothetical protein